MPLSDYPRVPIDRSQARSMVISTHGIVASEHPLASQAGAMVLSRGGHAVDAAIAANAVMGVVAPMMCGLGGDLFAIVSESDGTLHGVNASGWAPAAMGPEFLQKKGLDTMPQAGVDSITVPGAVAGWSLLLERFSRVPLSSTLNAAIQLAENGFPVAEITAAGWANVEGFLRDNAQASNTFLPEGHVPRVGEIFRNADLAWSYRRLLKNGTEDFYRGEMAARILRAVVAGGGAMDAHDLSEFSAEWTDPITTPYRGWDVFEIPPNGAGIAALMMLNIMERFPIQQYGHNSVEALHILIEAKKLAYADMQRYVGDPRYVSVPSAEMLSKDYARDRAGTINPAKANGDVRAGRLPVHAGDTTYLCASDSQGNVASLIQSNFASFGSGIVAEGTGFALQNRGALFTLDPSHPNVLAPRKRPIHTIIPGLMRRGDQSLAFGIMGGWNQSQAHAQFVSNVVDHGMNIQAALEAPRFTKVTFEGRDVLMEQRIPEPVRAGLSAKGHEVQVQGDFSSQMGGGQAVMHDRKARVNYGASDPRKDGAAIPQG